MKGGLHNLNEGCGGMERSLRISYQGVDPATEKQEKGGRRYEGAVNACWTDDQPGNVLGGLELAFRVTEHVITRVQETISFPIVNSTCSIRIQAHVPGARHGEGMGASS